MEYLLYGLLGGLAVAVPALIYNHQMARRARQERASAGEPSPQPRSLRSRLGVVAFALACFALAVLFQMRW